MITNRPPVSAPGYDVAARARDYIALADAVLYVLGAKPQ
jgi:hypothetical protein